MTPPLPALMSHLPLDAAGRPVPFFASWIDGKPDFRVADPARMRDCHRLGLCWVCGGSRGSRRGSFVIGPMCAVNHVSSEPPSHRACAEWSAQACPFLTNPAKTRRDTNLPDSVVDPAGVMIERNPGVTLVWTSRTWKPFPVPPNGVLWNIGEPEDVSWWAQGRTATRMEILAAIDSGLPALREIAERDGERAVAALEAMTAEALELVP